MPASARAELAPGGGREVDRLPPAPVERRRPAAEQQRRARGSPTASDVRTTSMRAGRAAAGERAAPASRARAAIVGEPAVRVGRARPADVLEQRQILVAVGVEEALVEIDAARRGELARRVELALAVAQRLDDAAGEAAVARPRAACRARARCRGRARAARSGSASPTTRPPACARAAGARARSRALRDRPSAARRSAKRRSPTSSIAVSASPFSSAGRLGDEVREAELPSWKRRPATVVSGEARGADATAQQAVEDQRDDREAGDQRAVEVEEGADLAGPRAPPRSPA